MTIAELVREFTKTYPLRLDVVSIHGPFRVCGVTIREYPTYASLQRDYAALPTEETFILRSSR